MSTSELVQQPARMENYSPRITRPHSASSDRPSTSSTCAALLSPPLSISPEPVFIAHAAASQIVTNDHDSRANAWFDQHGIAPSGETALVSPAALKLVNKFLDQLVFSFLSVSKSTSLVSLRPAVSEVLKPKLARDAVSGADGELREYLGGGEDDALLSSEKDGLPSQEWDLELVWKRTRLRCMVYSSLGDMEEEDEDRYTAQEHLDGSWESGTRENESGIVSPAVAIFLTSILEFMAEQILIVGGQAAYNRLRMKYEKEEREAQEESLILRNVWSSRRLTWSVSHWTEPWESFGEVGRGKSARQEADPIVALTQVTRISPSDGGQTHKAALDGVAGYQHAAVIPLPMSVDDVREIEVPGLASQSDDEDYEAPSEADAASVTQPGAPGLNGTITPAESEKDANEEIEEVSHKVKDAVPELTHEPDDDPTDWVDTSKDIDSDCEFIEEEPQIMTSSRISFGGRVSPDDKTSSSHSSQQSSLRPLSIHSLRLIDVNTAKSPTTGSRQGSFEATDHNSGRGISISRPSSLHSPIVSELSSRNFAAAMQGVDVDPSPTSQNYPTLKPATSRSAPFVLAAPPTPQNYRENMKGLAKQQTGQSQPSNGLSNQKARGSEQDVQFAQEVAQSPSELTTQIYFSYNGQFNERGFTDPPHFKRERPPRNDQGHPSVRFGAPPKGFAQRLQLISSSSPVSHVRQRRGSEESRVSAMSSIGDAKSFEELIRGDETIQYTLTPQNMRDIESPDSPLSINAIPVPRPASGRTHSSSLSKHTGSHAHPLSDASKNASSLKGAARPSPSSSRVRPHATQARDARIDRNSLGISPTSSDLQALQFLTRKKFTRDHLRVPLASFLDP
ncbi:hypothetical protein DID88_003267 [Monilinia fructigena]|uniref:Uncharacterized protein n=1 Tax=Monilinia fructigena TaxID=38457 RepID=A0A395J0E7_9HELO|nr:hypothetical protein DID88_003267 [Monilinia fructigena]